MSSTNGSAHPVAGPMFPLESFREAAQHLRRPFTPAAVKFKVQATWPKGNPTGGLVVAYIDARLAVERLNLIVPHLWHDAYRPVGGNQMWCDLTVDSITRSDVGEGAGKGLVSDALKRAAVKFGVGVSLYAAPKAFIDTESDAKQKNGGRDGLTLELTLIGERRIREAYAVWLTTHGIAAFGEPLDHGDVLGAQGDAEVEADPVTGEVIPAATPELLVSPEAIEELKAAAKGRTVAQIQMAFGACKLAVPPGTPAQIFDHVPAAKAAELAVALAGGAS